MKMVAHETKCVCKPEVTDSVQTCGHDVQAGRSILILRRNFRLRMQDTNYSNSLKVEAIYPSETVAPTKLHGVTLCMTAILTVSAVLGSGLFCTFKTEAARYSDGYVSTKLYGGTQ